jgi:hypothetical protein
MFGVRARKGGAERRPITPAGQAGIEVTDGQVKTLHGAV